MRYGWSAIAYLALTACTPDANSQTVPGFGHVPVQVELTGLDIAPADVTAVTLGGVHAYDLVPLDGALQVTVQGGEPGEAEVLLWQDALATPAGTVVYEPPVHPLFDRVVALGASLTQGTWDGAPSMQSQLSGPASVVARQAGANFPLPLLQPGLFPQVQPSDFGPPPSCTPPNLDGFAASTVPEVLPRLTDEEGSFSWAGGRIDPSLEPANVAVGGWLLDNAVHGVEGVDLNYTFLGHLTLDPAGGVADPLIGSQLDRVEAWEPTLILSTDLYGNDVIPAIFDGVVDVTQITPEAEVAASLGEAVERLAATGAEVFLANLPRVDFLGPARDLQGPELDTVVAAGLRYNELLDEEAARYGNVHVVDAAGWVDRLGTGPIPIGDREVFIAPLGGLLSLDGVHFTATGYAVLAQLFLDAIAEETGVQVAAPDLEAIAGTDPRTPWNLAAAGLDPEDCEAL